MSILPLTFRASSITIERMAERCSLQPSIVGIVLIALVFASCARAAAGRPVPPPSEARSDASRVEAPKGPGFSEPIQVPAVALKPVDARQQTASPSPAAGDFLIPGSGEDPRYPRDFAIGNLGAEKDIAGVRAFARRVLKDILLKGTEISGLSHLPSQDIAALKGILAASKPTAVRLAAGISDPGGGYSYLIRFIGDESSTSGELYLVPDGDSWMVDEIRLDPPASNTVGDGINRYDPFTYTRFF